ncbi:hypothetical protein N7454_007300 [Penicillium verhagenii]|nr:hypothetical protein N7454_007300 [Penicillium verhagenii]
MRETVLHQLGDEITPAVDTLLKVSSRVTTAMSLRKISWPSIPFITGRDEDWGRVDTLLLHILRVSRSLSRSPMRCPAV